MKTFTLTLALLATLGIATAGIIHEFEAEIEDEDDDTIEMITDETELVLDFLSVPIIPERYKTDKFKQTWGITHPLDAFHWKDCGGYGAHVLSLAVTPDPIKLPGEITFSVHVAVNTTVVAPLKGQLTIEKKVFDRYIKLPCVDNFGSCTYDDICSMLPSGPCPPVLAKHGIPCHCPVQPGVYSLPPISESAPKVPLLPGGDYRITAALFDTAAKTAFCLQLELSISK